MMDPKRERAGVFDTT